MTIDEALNQYRDGRFEYGTLDCCLFVCNVIRDVTGKDFADGYRDTYQSVYGAARIVKRAGGFIALMNNVFGSLIRPAAEANPGDPILVCSPYVEKDRVGKALGFFDGDEIYVMTQTGLINIPFRAGQGCWHV